MRSVVFLSHSAADSGAEQALLIGLSAWPRGEPRDPRPLVHLAEDGPLVERARRLGVETLVTPLSSVAQAFRRQDRNPLRLLATLAALVAYSTQVVRVLRERRAEVVVANSVKSLVYGLLAGRRTGAKVVWSVHDRISPDYLPRAAVPVLRHLVPRLVDGIIVNSESTATTLRPGRTPVLVAHPPIALDPRDFAAPSDPVRSVVMIGRLAPWKAQDNFLRAFARVFAGTGARATVVGGALFGEADYAQSLVRLAADLGIAEQVEFTGHVTDVWAHLVDADVLVHCSRTPEPFGQVVVQGMWARCAVVAAAPGGPAEVVTDGVDGLLTPCGDVDALTGALARLRDDPALRRELAERGRRTARRFGGSAESQGLREWLRLLATDQLTRGSVARP